MKIKDIYNEEGLTFQEVLEQFISIYLRSDHHE